MWKKFFFTHKQKQGLLVMLLIIAGVACIQAAIHYFAPLPDITALAIDEPVYIPPVFDEEEQTLLDINRADSAAWDRLPGIGPVLSARIVKYRRSVGGFRSVEQLKEVYGLPAETFERIREQLYVSAFTAPTPPTYARRAPQRQPKAAPPRLDINTATAEELRQLPGIGPVLSERIVKYRRSLGGFDQVEQLAQVYQLEATTLDALRPYLYVDAATRPAPKQLLITDMKPGDAPAYRTRGDEAPAAPAAPALLDLNTSDSASLVVLPGIGPVLARRIVIYRKLIGHYARPEYVRAVYGLSDEHYTQMQPYLRVDPATAAPAARLDLNTVSDKVLRRYPHMREEVVKAVMTRRRELGRFGTWEEVAAVDGLDAKALQVLRDYFKI
ncbi:MAG: hypothetical protein OHK0039_28930 [Bacteroidia bacterium]